MAASMDGRVECPFRYLEVDPENNAAAHGVTRPRERGKSRLRASSIFSLCIQVHVDLKTRVAAPGSALSIRDGLRMLNLNFAQKILLYILYKRLGFVQMTYHAIKLLVFTDDVVSPTGPTEPRHVWVLWQGEV